MKRAAALLLAIGLLTGCLPGEPDARVLFIGNSYTFYNNLPRMVADLADSAGIHIEAEAVAEGGPGFETIARPGRPGSESGAGTSTSS